MIRLTLALVALALTQLQIRTNAGRDHQARVMGDHSSDGTGAYAPACYMGLSPNTDPPDPASTSLAGEVTTGTLARAQATFAHTNGTNVYTLTKSFTSDQSITAAKVGVFTEPSGGVMTFEGLLSSPAVLNSGDQVQITYAVNL